MESLYTHDSMSCNKSLWLRQKNQKSKTKETLSNAVKLKTR